jgi:hypothetical protein
MLRLGWNREICFPAKLESNGSDGSGLGQVQSYVARNPCGLNVGAGPAEEDIFVVEQNLDPRFVVSGSHLRLEEGHVGTCTSFLGIISARREG